jgi:hypothetical protein
MGKVNMMAMEQRERLADAAPEMLEELLNARAWVRHWQRDFDAGLKPTPESLRDADAALTTIIVKARGR